MELVKLDNTGDLWNRKIFCRGCDAGAPAKGACRDKTYGTDMIDIYCAECVEEDANASTGRCGVATVRGGIEYHIQVVIAGRDGVQEEYETNKREAIRKARRLTGLGGFGSTASVAMVSLTSTGRQKRRLLFQCTKVKRRDGTEYVKSEEL